jgi:hypothetical protein
VRIKEHDLKIVGVKIVLNGLAHSSEIPEACAVPKESWIATGWKA